LGRAVLNTCTFAAAMRAKCFVFCVLARVSQRIKKDAPHLLQRRRERARVSDFSPMDPASGAFRGDHTYHSSDPSLLAWREHSPIQRVLAAWQAEYNRAHLRSFPRFRAW
jgi:hypothetical protein